MKKLASLFFVFLPLVCMQVNAQSYMDYFDRATRAEQQDSLLQAEGFYLQAIRLEPKNRQNALVYANVARLQRRQNRAGDALSSYNTSLAFQPYSIPVLLDRANLLLEMGEDERALVDCSMVRDLDSLNREALLMRSYLNYKKREYREAETDYLRLLRTEPSDSIASMGIAVLYQAWEKPEKSIEVWNRMIERNPQDASFYLYRAEVERSCGRYELALMDVDKYTSLTEPSADIWVLRGDLCLNLGKKEQARRNFLQAIEKGKPRYELNERLKKTK